MYRISLAVATLASLVGCSQSTPSSPGDLATPLAAAPASAAVSAPVPAAEAPVPSDQAASDPDAPTAQPRAAAKPVVAGVPPVLLSATETGLCKLAVGDELPAIELPKLGGGDAKLADLVGKRATVVLFWTPDPWMSRTALADLQRDVTDNSNLKGVAVIGIVVGAKADAMKLDMGNAGAKFTQLIDVDGKTLAECGSPTLPRVYVIDGDKKIAWFDIEYSETTRRELHATLVAVAPGEK